MNKERQLAEREQRLKARKRDNRWKTLVVCIVIGAVLVTGLFLLFDLKGASITDESGKLSLTANQGFPYQIENTSSSKNSLKSTKDQLVLLNGTLLEIVNPANGKKMKSQIHFFSNPVFDVNGKYVLTFDQGRKKLRIDTAANTLFENALEQNIITAAIGADGTFAVATVPEQGNSALTVYSKSLNELFTWNSTDGYIIEMDVSKDGKYVAVAAASSVDAGLKTKVHIISVKNKQEVAAFEFDGTSVSVLQYVSGNDLFVISTMGCTYISNNKDRTELLPAGEQTLLDYSFSDAGVLSVLYTKYDGAASSTLTSFSTNGKELYHKEIAEAVKDLYNSRSASAVLFSDRVETYDKKGALLSTTEVTPYAKELVQFGAKLYLLSVDELECVTVKAV